MKALELKVPPPAVGVLIAAAMWAMAQVLPATLAVPNPHFAAAVIALAGIAFDVLGILSFRRAKTTINPLTPGRTSALVSSGVYRITRNPMYVGLLFLLIAWAIFMASPWALLGPLAFVLYMNRFQISPEERVLEGLFGEDFANYRSKVRRWL